MRTLLYSTLVWVALLRTALAPFSADVLDDVVALSVPQASDARSDAGCSVRHALLHCDLDDPLDEGKIAESDPSPDDELAMVGQVHALAELLAEPPGPAEGPSFVSRTTRDRLDRPPRG